MPSRLRLYFQPTGRQLPWPTAYPATYDLRRQLVRLLRQHAQVDALRGNRYVLTVTQEAPQVPESLALDLSVADDGIVPAIRSGLESLKTSHVEFSVGQALARLSGFKEICTVSVERLMDFPGTTMIRVDFVTTTTFAAGDRRSRGVADPGLIVGSWASSWNGSREGEERPTGSVAGATGEACPPDTSASLGRLLDPTKGDLTWERVVLGIYKERPPPRAPRSLYGFRGHLTLRLHRSAGPDASLWLARLAGLAPFVGTGYHVQLGFGATETVMLDGRSAGPIEP